MVIKALKILSVAAFIAVAGCSSMASLPGGSDSVNTEEFQTKTEMFDIVGSLKPGVGKDKVFEILGMEEADFYNLSRNETVMALYGTDNIDIPDAANFLKKLKGYSFNYQKVDRSHGLSSPISMKTRQSGYRYVVTLVFKDEKLYEAPIISGGEVEDTKSRTIFEYLSPGKVVSAAIP